MLGTLRAKYKTKKNTQTYVSFNIIQNNEISPVKNNIQKETRK